MASNNQTLNWVLKKLCSWGIKNPKRIIGQTYVGASAPLFRNNYKTFFLVFSILNVLVVGIDIVAYVVNMLTLNDKTNVCFHLDECVL